MKLQNVWFVRFNLLLGLALLGFGFAGCKAPDYQAAMLRPEGVSELVTNLPRLRIGDTVTVTLSGVPDAPLPLEKPIKEDGTITLQDIGPVQAAGQTAGELEDIIHNLYVPAIYRHINVTVKTSSDLVYFVRGEVKQPGRVLYVGPVTVSKAITSAGDFTDFANRKKIFLTRSNGQRFKLNCVKILEGEAPDPPIFPGDQIEVKRRLW
jgi:polysaccharide export outer membrane protein